MARRGGVVVKHSFLVVSSVSVVKLLSRSLISVRSSALEIVTVPPRARSHGEGVPPLPTVSWSRGHYPDLSVSRNKQQETTWKSLVNCKSKQTCSHFMVFQKEIKTSPFGFSRESRNAFKPLQEHVLCLPGA